MAQARSDQISEVLSFGWHQVIHRLFLDSAGVARFSFGVILSNDITALLEPGSFVRHPQCPEWGLGQVQSNIDGKVTVNFENEGKVVIDGRRIALIMEFPT